MNWHIIRTATRQETRAKEALIEHGWAEQPEDEKPSVYLPVETRWRWLGDEKERIHPPLFPGYLFAQVDMENFARVLDLDSVHQIVCPHTRVGEPIHLPGLETEVIALQAREAAGEFDKTRRNRIQVGQTVRIVRGHFIGYLAEIRAIKDGAHRVSLAMPRMGGMEVDMAAVEPLCEDAA